MQELLEAGGPLGSKKRALDPRRRLQLGAGRQRQRPRDHARRKRLLQRDRRRLPQPRCRSAGRAASRRTCTRRPTSLETWIDHVLVRPKIKAVKSGHRRHQAGRRPLPLRPRGHLRHAPSEVRIVAGRWGGRRLTTPRGPRPRARRRTACARRCSRSWASASRARACSTCSPAPARSGSRRSRAAPRRRRSWTPRPPRSAAVRANLEALGGEAEVRRADALRFLRSRSGEDSPLRSRPSRPAISPGGAPRARAVGGAASACWRPPRSSSARATAGRRCLSTCPSETNAATATP